MEMRFGSGTSKQISKGSKAMQRRSASSIRTRPKTQDAPDLTDFMNDMFFGALNAHNKAYNLTGMYQEELTDQEEDSFDKSNRSCSSKLTEEWLDQARRLVAASPSRCSSPSRVVSSPRFAAVVGKPSASLLDGRDPLSRSARRNRAVDSFSGEILSKVAHHNRNKSESFLISGAADAKISSASAVQKWISNILKPPNPTLSNSESSYTTPTPRKSRFHADPSPPGLPIPPSKTCNDSTSPSDALLSPPKNLVESAHRRTLSGSVGSFEKRRSNGNGFTNGSDGNQESLNGFLREQRQKIRKIFDGELNAKAKIILSGPSNSTSSMVAAVCYAWLLENKIRRNKAGNGEDCAVVPVINMQRAKMWNHQQGAWLFYHLGLDAASILFTDEVYLENSMTTDRISVEVVGQDVLKMSNGVGSQCTILTDYYCEDAYDLLQTPLLKNLLLAGILLDTENLDASAQSSMTRDAEAVQLLLVGSAPNYRNRLYDQLMEDQKDGSFLVSFQQSYGKTPNEGTNKGELQALLGNERNLASILLHDDSSRQQKKLSDLGTKNSRISPKAAKPGAVPIQTPAREEAANTSRGKNKFFLAKWFGFGSK